MSKVIGIDLGTKSSSVAIMEGRLPKVICSIPSVVAITESNDLIVGQPAQQFATENPESTFSSFHRLLGVKYDTSYVSERSRTSPYNIINGSNGYAWLESRDTSFSPIEITAYILMQLKKAAEEYLGATVTDAVISVPNYFDMVQRQAVKDAGKIAGLNVLRLTAYSVYAALAYGLDRLVDEKIAFIDFGAGSLDVAILELGDGEFEVRSTNGDLFLGGDDFEQLVIDWIADEYKRDTGIDLRDDKIALQRLKGASGNAMCELSTTTATDVYFPFITADASAQHLTMQLTRAKLESICSSLLDNIDEPCYTAIKDAGLTAADIDKVILVGGMSLMPVVKKRIERIFNNAVCQICHEDNLVVKGAAIDGGVLRGDVKDVLLKDVTAFSLGIEMPGGVMTRIIEKNTTIPCRKSQVFTTLRDNQSAFPVTVLQGDREMAKNNKTLGSFELSGIPSAPRGLPQIEVTFDIDAKNGVHVNAKDLGSGKEQSISISASLGLSKKEIDKLERKAEAHTDKDKKKREVIEARIHADSMVCSTEKALKEHGHKIDAVEKGNIKNKLAELKKIMEGEDTEVIKKATDELSQASHKLAEAMYSKLSVFNFEENINKYDLAAIRGSHVQYFTETIRWFDNLLTYLDAFIHEHADLLSEAQMLTKRLAVANHDNQYPVLTDRAEYLAHHLDFGVETLQGELIAFKNEVVDGRNTLANARNLTGLREIEKLERPDFYLVAEHTVGMVKRQLTGVDWFREHKELAATLIDLHEAWRDEFHLFEHTTRDHFMQKCKDESIDDELADGWFAEWRKERLLLEEHLLPLMKAGIEKLVPVEVVIAAVEVLKTGIRDQLEKFFKEERVELYNEPECRQANGSLLERLKRDNRLAHINFEFQKSLEELIFRVETTEGRQFLVEWAKEWYDTPITSVLVYIEKDSLQEESAQMILDEFRSMKVRNFNMFLADARSYPEARRKMENKWNSLMRRMEEDLKKKGK